jgi:hypothetical protein
MVSRLFYYQLALLALVWFFVILHVAGSRRTAQRPQPRATPIIPRRKGTDEPKTFEGLTIMPYYALCEREATHPQPPSAVSPNPMPPTKRHPREIDTSQPFCLHLGCDYWGWLGLGKLRANGHPNGGPWRQFHCVPRAGGTFGRRTARSSMAKRPPWSCSCGYWRAWPRGWASAPPRGSSRLTPIPCFTGWSKRWSSCGSFRGTFSVRGMSDKYNLTSCMPCRVRSKTLTSARPRH